MGLDAFVYCNCLKTGQTAPYPFDFGWCFDDEGYLVPDLEDDGSALYYEKYNALYAWAETCCEHPGMAQVSVRLANWSGYRAFWEALERIGWQHFPTLYAELPEANSGQMAAAAAASVLPELERFRQLAGDERVTFLVNTETDEIIHQYIAAYGGLFMFAAGTAGINLGVDPRGFFIVTSDTKSLLPNPANEVFRSPRVEQRVLERDEHGHPMRFEFFDADGENRFISTVGVTIHTARDNGQWESTFPRLLHVEERPTGADEYNYILEPLAQVCRASVETGNPVMWV